MVSAARNDVPAVTVVTGTKRRNLAGLDDGDSRCGLLRDVRRRGVSEEDIFWVKAKKEKKKKNNSRECCVQSGGETNVRQWFVCT